MIIEIIKAGKLPGVRVEDFRQSVYPAIHAEAQDWQQTKEEEDQLNELERSLEQYKSDDWKDDETMQRWVRRSKVMLEVQRDYVRHSFRYLQMLRA